MDNITHTQSRDGILKNAARIDESAAETAGSLTHAITASTSTADQAAGTTTKDGQDLEAAGEAVPVEEARAPKQRRWLNSSKSKNKSYSHAHFRVYKRRWFGLAQLVLLNIVVSWDVMLSPSPSL